MSTCYVIMPYGGDDPEQKAKYQGIYENIFKPAILEAGIPFGDYREDYVGEPGTILRNIIMHITEADVLIADLSCGNANVHYELGIAHSFHKRATVLVCEEGTELPFDLQSQSVTYYSTDVARMGEAKRKIIDAIRQRLSSVSSTDNPVHEHVGNMPVRLLDLFNGEKTEAEEQVRVLQEENDKLRKKIAALGKDSENIDDEIDIEAAFRNLKLKYKYAGSTAVEKLRELKEKGDIEAFLDELLNVLSAGWLSNSDVTKIIEICEEIENPSISVQVYEYACNSFPEDSDFSSKLAKLYAKYPRFRQKAIDTANRAIGLKKDENGNYCDFNGGGKEYNAFARFCDTYLQMEEYGELIKAATYMKDRVNAEIRDLLQRNIFDSLISLGEYQKAEELIPVLKAQNHENAYYRLFKYYDDISNYPEAYYSLECAMISAPSDPDYPRMLAVEILNYKYYRVRKSDSAEGIEKFSIATASRIALAFLLYSIKIDPSQAQRVLTIMRRPFNKLLDEVDPLIESIKNGTELPFELSDISALNYCLERIDPNN